MAHTRAVLAATLQDGVRRKTLHAAQPRNIHSFFVPLCRVFGPLLRLCVPFCRGFVPLRRLTKRADAAPQLFTITTCTQGTAHHTPQMTRARLPLRPAIAGLCGLAWHGATEASVAYRRWGCRSHRSSLWTPPGPNGCAPHRSRFARRHAAPPTRRPSAAPTLAPGSPGHIGTGTGLAAAAFAKAVWRGFLLRRLVCILSCGIYIGRADSGRAARGSVSWPQWDCRTRTRTAPCGRPAARNGVGGVGVDRAGTVCGVGHTFAHQPTPKHETPTAATPRRRKRRAAPS